MRRGERPSEVNKRLGASVHKFRVAAGVTQVSLARQLRVSQASVSRWEKVGADVLGGYIPAIETILNLPKGTIWMDAGLISDELRQQIRGVSDTAANK